MACSTSMLLDIDTRASPLISIECMNWVRRQKHTLSVQLNPTKRRLKKKEEKREQLQQIRGKNCSNSDCRLWANIVSK